MLQAKPLHAVDNRLHRLWCGSLHIGIFNPQNKLAAMMAGIGPGIQGSTGTAQMQKTGRTWRKTSSYSHDKKINNRTKGIFYRVGGIISERCACGSSK